MANITSRKLLTLILVLDENEQKVLLGMKKRGFGAGKYNGFGGKVEPGETIEQGARRELLEESELEAIDMEKIGIVLFSFEDDPVGLETHIYYTTRYTGVPHETEEMNPQWFSYADIPFHQMWADDELWFPYVFAKTKFSGHFHFAKDQKTVLSQHLAQDLNLDIV